MKKTHDKVLICNSCYYRLDCNDSSYGDNLCLLYKKDPDIEFNEDKKVSTESQKIGQDTIRIKNHYFKLLHKKMK